MRQMRKHEQGDDTRRLLLDDRAFRDQLQDGWLGELARVKAVRAAAARPVCQLAASTRQEQGGLAYGAGVQ